MERDSLISHGATEFLRDRLCIVSDAYTTVYCRNCKQDAISTPENISCRRCQKDITSDPSNFLRCTTPRAWTNLVHLIAGFGVRVQQSFREQPETDVGLISAPSELSTEK